MEEIIQKILEDQEVTYILSYSVRNKRANIDRKIINLALEISETTNFQIRGDLFQELVDYIAEQKGLKT